MDAGTFHGVTETLLVTLFLRAEESQRPDALIRDEKAVELVKKIGDEGRYDFTRIKLLHLNRANKLVIIMRSRQFDRITLEFLRRHPNAYVVHIGCGLDSRFERLAAQKLQVEWYDLDIPEVIEMRRVLYGDEGDHYHLFGCSVLEKKWIEALENQHEQPFLFVAEGVCMYLTKEQNKSLIRRQSEHFPGAELVFDIYSPFHTWYSNIQTAGFGFKTRWCTWTGKEVERWGKGIRLLDTWGYLDTIEPRTRYPRWLRPIEALFKTLCIYHYQLGEAS